MHLPIRLEMGAQVKRRLWQRIPEAQGHDDEEAARTAVPVERRMHRLERVVNRGDLHALVHPIHRSGIGV